MDRSHSSALGPLLHYISPAPKDHILGDGFYVWATGVIIDQEPEQEPVR